MGGEESTLKAGLGRIGVLVIAVLALASAPVVVAPTAASAQVNPAPRVVSLGDSYTAGNGAEGTTVAGAANAYFGGSCSQHPDAYPFLVVNQISDATLDHLACSGATIPDVLGGQIATIPNASDVDFYFLTIGGNDFGFESVVATCLVLPLPGLCNLDLDEAEASLPTVESGIESILDELTLLSPQAEIVLVGYPQLASPLCPTPTVPQDRLIDLQELFEQTQSQIAAARSNVSFVSVADAFADNGPCLESPTAPFTPGAGLVHHLYLLDPFAESFHPNRDGHIAIEREIVDRDNPPVTLCNGLLVTVDLGAGDVPTSGDDVILGTTGDDTINAGDGDDVVCAGEGEDVVLGQNGNDVIFGGPGADTLSGNAGDDELFGGAGADSIFGGSGKDLVSGGFGSDIVLGGSSGADTVLGGPGDDTITGGSDADTLVSGGEGNDAVNGGGGDDLAVHGDAGDDTVSGNGGQDIVYGDDGNDEVRGGQADDEVFGGAGDDFVAGNAGTDICDGGTAAEVAGDTAAVNCETVVNVP